MSELKSPPTSGNDRVDQRKELPLDRVTLGLITQWLWWTIALPANILSTKSQIVPQ